MGSSPVFGAAAAYVVTVVKLVEEVATGVCATGFRRVRAGLLERHSARACRAVVAQEFQRLCCCCTACLAGWLTKARSPFHIGWY